MDFAKQIEKLADPVQGNFKVSLVKAVLGSTVGFLATFASVKLVDVVTKNNHSTPITIAKP